MNELLKTIAPMITDYTYRPRTLEITGHYEPQPGIFKMFGYRGIDAIRLRLELLTIEEECRCVGR